MLNVKELRKALEEGKEVVMRKYIAFGCWSAPKKVSSEVALRKACIYVVDDCGVAHCPYGFELA